MWISAFFLHTNYGAFGKWEMWIARKQFAVWFALIYAFIIWSIDCGDVFADCELDFFSSVLLFLYRLPWFVWFSAHHTQYSISLNWLHATLMYAREELHSHKITINYYDKGHSMWDTFIHPSNPQRIKCYLRSNWTNKVEEETTNE